MPRRGSRHLLGLRARASDQTTGVDVWLGLIEADLHRETEAELDVPLATHATDDELRELRAARRKAAAP